MTNGQRATIAAGFLGAFALGVWAGPRFSSHPTREVGMPVAAVATPTAETPANVPASRPRAAVVNASLVTTFAPLRTSISPGAPELHTRLKPLLKAGADMEVAAEGFHSAEQFATVVHASQNVNVPFMLLKHRVLNEGDTLVAAIRKSKSDVDAVVEADRARAEARSDIASLD